MRIYSAKNDEELNKIFLQIVSQPTTSLLRLMETLKCELNTIFHCEFNKINGNILIHFPRKLRVTTISIRSSRYDGYELALLDTNTNTNTYTLRYCNSIGYSDVTMFDTDNEVIQEVQRVYSELCEMQKLHNKKCRRRRKIRKNRLF